MSKLGKILWISWILTTIISYLFFLVHPFWAYQLGSALFLGFVVAVAVTSIAAMVFKYDSNENFSLQDLATFRFLEWRDREDHRL